VYWANWPVRGKVWSSLDCATGIDNPSGGRRPQVYRYVNRFTRDDTYPLPDISSVFQRIGRCNFVTVADCKAGYWQIPMLDEDKNG